MATGKKPGRPPKNKPSTPPKDVVAEETPEQKKIEELEAKLALLMSRLETPVDVGQAPTPEVVEEKVSDDDGKTIVIHVLEDGFTAIGRTWYRGQELTFTVGTQQYENNKVWLNQTKQDQYRRWGKPMFDHGPWPGGDWLDREDLDFGGPTRQEFGDVVPKRSGTGPKIRA
jgi:hypothetical protein